MKVRDIMTCPAISISPGENVEVAARLLDRYNIGALPVCAPDGRLCGMVTDRDLVIRCIAAGRVPGKTTVRQVMSGGITSVGPDMDIGVAAHLMGRCQIRRLPVTENGKLRGMMSLADLACADDSAMDAADALADVSSNISQR